MFFFFFCCLLSQLFINTVNATDSRTDNNITTHLKLVRGRDRCHAVAAAVVVVVVYILCAFFSFPLSSTYMHNIVGDSVASLYPLGACFSRSATAAVFFVFTFFFFVSYIYAHTHFSYELYQNYVKLKEDLKF